MKLLEKLLNAKKFSNYQLKDDQGVSVKYTDSYYDSNTNTYYKVYTPFWYLVALVTMPIMIIFWIYSKLNSKFKLHHFAYKSKSIKYKGQSYHIFHPAFNMLVNARSISIVHWSTEVANKSLQQRYKDYVENPEKVNLLRITYQDSNNIKIAYAYDYIDAEVDVYFPDLISVESITFNTKAELKSSTIKKLFKYYDSDAKRFYT
jgi:hypothetical protein